MLSLYYACMNRTKTVKHVLQEAETALVGLAGEAGATRDYDSAQALFHLAREIKHLAENFEHSLGAFENRQLDAGIAANGSAGVAASPPRSLSQKRRQNRLGEYPRFVREGESLVKIAWSKSERTEYEHKCPREALIGFCASLQRAGAEGGRFSMDRVLPVNARDGETEVPSYQCYLCLAWLRALGLVTQHGRQGYSLPDGVKLHDSVQAHWSRLPTR